MKKAAFLLAIVIAGTIASCTPPEPPVRGPQSDLNVIPWNRAQPGEGGAAFGGALQQR